MPETTTTIGTATIGTAPMGTATIDDFLGPAESRFFGEGFRRVGHRIRDVGLGVGEDGRGHVRGTAFVTYPVDWSEKDGVVHPPHLSTIDAMLLGVQLAEIHLVRAFRLTGAQRRRMWLRRIEVKPGARPQEDLAGFPVSARCVASGASSSAPGVTSVFECLVGTVKVRCEVDHGSDHDSGRQAVAEGFLGDADDALGAASHRFYGAGYQSRNRLIEHVSVDLDRLRTQATVRMDPWQEEGSADEGIEAFYQPTLSMIDCALIFGQLGQVLMYQLDHLDRRSTNSLWLRRVIMERSAPRTSPADSLSTAVDITKSQLLTLGGSPWRSCDLVGECSGITVRYRLAHELPHSHGGGSR